MDPYLVPSAPKDRLKLKDAVDIATEIEYNMHTRAHIFLHEGNFHSVNFSVSDSISIRKHIDTTMKNASHTTQTY